MSHAVDEFHDPLNALAAICVIVRREQPRISRGYEPEHRVAFLYSELEWAGEEDTGIPELLAFMKKTLPEIPLWNVTEGGLTIEIGPPPTSPPNVGKPASDQTAPLPSETSKPTSGYSPLRLAGSYEDEDQAPSEKEAGQPDPDSDAPEAPPEETRGKEGDPNSTRARTEITLEEMEMLRGDFSDTENPDQDPPTESEEPSE